MHSHVARLQLRGALVVSAFALIFLSAPVRAQSRGFELNRYEPTAAGEWSFAVAHPWYSGLRMLAAGLTMNYAHNPLIVSQARSDGTIARTEAIIGHQLTGHVDLAASFLNRALITLSMPITFIERGDPTSSMSIAPADGPYVSDPRIGAMVRIWGDPYGSAFSVSAGGNVWIPLRAFADTLPEHSSDQQVRGLIQVAMGGLVRHILWSATVGALIRPDAQLGDVADPGGRSAGHELQVGFALAYANTHRRFAVGPEVLMATAMTGQIFQPLSTSVEALLGGHYNIAGLVQVGVAGGVGVLRQAGTPDARVLLRLAYAPMGQLPRRAVRPEPAPETAKVAEPARKAGGKDRDQDGVLDVEDLCPDQVAGEQPDPNRRGCPALDKDGDGIFDHEDLCPTEPQGQRPDPAKRGCPLVDKDGDGVADSEDQCPDQAAGDHPDPAKRGCPAGDKDGDGVLDSEDQCPDQAKGDHPDASKPGCPAGDKDGDGVFDSEDQCVDTAAGALPDPDRKGCPASDRDGDLVPDSVDACPDSPGVPEPDAKKSGCPNPLVEIHGGQIIIKRQIFFAFNKDLIMPVSVQILQAVANVMKNTPQIKKLRVEGHTDNSGNPAANLWLSGRRAEAVMRWLADHGVDSSRLDSQGFGDTHPIGDNQTQAGRVQNRRVDFVIVE